MHKQLPAEEIINPQEQRVALVMSTHRNHGIGAICRRLCEACGRPALWRPGLAVKSHVGVETAILDSALFSAAGAWGDILVREGSLTAGNGNHHDMRNRDAHGHRVYVNKPCY